jgi:anaerobic magnesium-protoporphyrin IX monomethyl ester cyclase
VKILLIDPYISSKNEYGSLTKLSNIIPSLGLGYVAASLKKHGFEVKILDCSVAGITTKELVKIVKKENPAAVGFTATVMSINSAISSLKAIKDSLPKIYSMIGGPQITALSNQTMESSGFDVGVIGEGEITTVELLSRIRDGNTNIAEVKGIIYRKESKFVFSGHREHLQELSALPRPSYELFPPLSSYSYSPISTLKYPCAHIISSRGCPFTCRFCDKTVTGSVFRARRSYEVIEEIAELVKNYKIKEIKFFDDNFTYDQARVYEICDLLDKSNLKISWSCVAHAARVNKDLLIRMRRSGCWQVVFGMESGNQSILDSMRKPLTLDQSRKAAKISRQAGINVRATFILGFPGETQSTLNDTLHFAKELKLDTVSFYIFSPYPGSEIFKELKDNGEIIHSDYQYYQLIVDPRKSKLPFVPKGIAKDDLLRHLQKSYKDFYLRPGYLFSQIGKIKSFDYAKRYWKCCQELL